MSEPSSQSRPPALVLESGDAAPSLRASGNWTVAYIDEMQSLAEATGAAIAGKGVAVLNMGKVSALDTFGSLLLLRLIRHVEVGRDATEVLELSDHLRPLFDKVRATSTRPLPEQGKTSGLVDHLEAVGRSAVDVWRDLFALAEMFGSLAAAIVRTILQPRRFRLTSAIHHLDRVAWQAVPIILLITFLIGGIIAQQGFFHFRKFGADIYVVDMVGILVLREIGVLIVAIMVAGRSGSSYTAELGSMKMREEIDALQTMGLDPIEVLVLPRVVALVIALPILTFLGSISALYGGELVAWCYGGMNPEIFLARLREAISVTHFKVGMIKAPFMALVIGVVACAQGLQVKGSAESLGLQTTASVVKAIFLVIVIDGFFAVFFASIDM